MTAISRKQNRYYGNCISRGSSGLCSSFFMVNRQKLFINFAYKHWLFFLFYFMKNYDTIRHCAGLKCRLYGLMPKWAANAQGGRQCPKDVFNACGSVPGEIARAAGFCIWTDGEVSLIRRKCAAGKKQGLLWDICTPKGR